MRLRNKSVACEFRHQECQTLRWQSRALKISPRLAVAALMAMFLFGGGSTTRVAQAQNSNVPPPPSASAPASAARPQRELAPATTITVDASQQMFTTMCALLASGFEADISAENWRPLRAQLRERMQHQEGPAVEAVRAFYKEHVSA